MTTIAIDLGGTKVKMGVVDNGLVVNTYSFNSNSGNGLLSIIPEIENKCNEWISNYPVKGIEVAYPGIVDPVKKCVIAHSNKFADAVDFNFQEWSDKKFSLPIILENDANAAAVGENIYGCAKKTNDMVLLILGTGIGSAAIMNGKLIHGKHYQAGCFLGHIPLKVNGRKCDACGGIGCAEAQASTWALSYIANEAENSHSNLKNEKTIDFKVLKKYYDSDDEAAKRIFSECCEYWANCIIALIYAYDPDTVVLSGGVLKWSKDFPY